MATRKYTSSLREQQTQETRLRILEGAGRLTLFDFNRITHAAVARSADVSERTVYRHFPTVDALHSAFAEFQEKRFGRDATQQLSLDNVPTTYEAWPERIEASGALDYLLTESAEPPMVTETRRSRYMRLQRALAEVLPDATEAELRQLVLVFGALVSPEVFRRAKLIFNLDPRDVVPGPAWALRVLIKNLREGNTPWK